jgi:hypothetical protein
MLFDASLVLDRIHELETGKRKLSQQNYKELAASAKA